MDAQKIAIELITDERKRQDEESRRLNRSDSEHSDLLWGAILVAEVGEISRELKSGDDIEHLKEEITQVAAVAVAWLEAIIEREGG